MKRILLGLNSLVAAAVGIGLTVDPVGFYAPYGVGLQVEASLLSDLRGMGLAVLAVAIAIGAGVFQRAHEQSALVLAAGFYGAFALGRLVSIAQDGLPSQLSLVALGIEVLLGGLSVMALRQRVAVPA